jgi:hypothetical protein|nr:MAG TPA: hypothetical protein [Bacteriophage sp.]
MNCVEVKIESADKYLNSIKRIHEFLTDECIIEQKSDGVMLSLLLKDKTGDYTKDWVVSYKNQIQYPNEFDFAGLNNIKSNSISNSQFRFIFEHLKQIDYSSLPVNTEFFVEFLMNKPELYSDYKIRHKMVLIGYSSTVFEEQYGILKSCISSFKTLKRDNYAEILKVRTPRPLFSGKLIEFENGILDDELKSKFMQIKNLLNPENYQDYLDRIKNLLLSVESKFGGKEEGIVITNSYGVFKYQQSYQNDTNLKQININKFKGTQDEELSYSNHIRLAALNIVTQQPRPFLQNNINNILKNYAESLGKLKIDFKHPKKTEFQIKEDIQHIIKKLVIKSLKGNNNFIFISKFSILTNTYFDMIKQALKEFDNGVICIVSNKDTINTRKIREQMIKECFPNIIIKHYNSANLTAILRNQDININAVVCDQNKYYRVKEILKFIPDIKAYSIKTEGINANSIIENIDNQLLFTRNTPKQIHSLYDKLKLIYKKGL